MAANPSAGSVRGAHKKVHEIQYRARRPTGKKSKRPAGENRARVGRHEGNAHEKSRHKHVGRHADDPVVAVIDDIHWAEPAFLDLLTHILDASSGAAILLLTQDGKLGLDDRLRHWLPSLPDATRPITIQHLLTHSSGLVDYEDLMDQDQTWQLRDQDVLHLLEGENRLYFAAGSGYRYSNGGYALLALIADRFGEGE